MLNENKHIVSQLTEAFEQKYLFDFLSLSERKHFSCSTISLRQTYEKRLAKQREESQRIGQSLDNYKVEILTIR